MSLEFDFAKMHGAGNDFIVTDARSNGFPVDEIREKAPKLCNRRTGIGADGILMLGNSQMYDYTMHYLNADGSEAGMCGNGARCLAQFAVHHGLDKNLTFIVHDSVYRAEVHDTYVSIHFPVHPQPEAVTIDNRPWYIIHAGTEHVVSIDPGYAETPNKTFRQTGRKIRNRNDLFPVGTNVNFTHVVHENRGQLVTYEKGVEDLTMACGTGAIATAIAWHHHKHHEDDGSIVRTSGVIEHYIQVDCPGGPLEVTFEADGLNNSFHYQNIVLHGPVVTVFKGQYRE